MSQEAVELPALWIQNLWWHYKPQSSAYLRESSQTLPWVQGVRWSATEPYLAYYDFLLFLRLFLTCFFILLIRKIKVSICDVISISIADSQKIFCVTAVYKSPDIQG